MFKGASLIRKITVSGSFFIFLCLYSRIGFSDDQRKFEPYGFIWVSSFTSDRPVDSFSQRNLVAPTAAANPQNPAGADLRMRHSLQLSQSRFGVNMKASPEVDGTLEFDFVDFKKSAPTVASQPRLRRAFVTYQSLSYPSLKFQFGQDWDLISPLSPFTYNPVEHQFESGDVGFMRVQAQAHLTTGSWTHSFAIGNPGNTNGATDTNFEQNSSPSLAFRNVFHFGEKNQAGVSGLYTSTLGGSGVITQFLQWLPIAGLEIREESYVGRNTQNLGMLGIGYGTKTQGIQEWGSYVSIRKQLNEKNALYLTSGIAKTINSNNVQAASYDPSDVIGFRGGSPGIQWNTSQHVGIEHKLQSSLVLFAEYTWYKTKYQLSGLSSDTSNIALANVVQLGTQYNF